MKNISRTILSALAILAIAQISAFRAEAQNAAIRPTTQRDAQTDARTNENSSSAHATVGKLDRRTSGDNVRASQLIGANIQNDAGDSVGEINDLVIDGNTGRVRYAAVTYGGFLGVGSKLFAGPVEAFHVKRKSENSNEYVLVLNVTKDQLKGAEGFDKDNWPNFADRNIARDLDQRYNVDRSAMRARGSQRGDRVRNNTNNPAGAPPDTSRDQNR